MIACSALVPGTCGMLEQVCWHCCSFVTKVDHVESSKVEFFADAKSVKFDDNIIFLSQGKFEFSRGEELRRKTRTRSGRL